jgi:hypothetical protein
MTYETVTTLAHIALGIMFLGFMIVITIDKTWPLSIVVAGFVGFVSLARIGASMEHEVELQLVAKSAQPKVVIVQDPVDTTTIKIQQFESGGYTIKYYIADSTIILLKGN